jgi:signal transduction histidine kinase
MLQRWRRWWASEARANALDALLAWGISGLAIFAVIATSPPDQTVSIVSVALLVIQSVALMVRRRWPMAVYTVVGVGTVAYAWVGDPAGSVGGLGVLVAIYTVAAQLPLRKAVVAGGIYVVGMAVTLAGFASRDPVSPALFLADFLVNLLALALAWTIGVTIRTRRAYVASLEARAAMLEREREDNARLAVALERGRIARELHDVVAHNVSVVAVQAAAAERLVDHQPDGAKELMRSVAQVGRDALAEMRRVVEVLREEEPPVALDPQPGIAELGSLIGRMRDAGLDVELSVQGTERPLPSSAALSVYRIVQEALTNTLRHAGPARARVIVRYLPDLLEVQVSDNGARRPAEVAAPMTAGGGHGIIGMRERVALFGGELSAGPRPEGGYAVVARIPIAGAGAA